MSKEMNRFVKREALALLSSIAWHNAVMADESRNDWHDGDDAAHEIVYELFEMLMIQAEAEGWYDVAAKTVNAVTRSYAAAGGLDGKWIAENSISGEHFRICERCGEPMEEGFMDDAGEAYVCERCFKAFMDEEYDEAWRCSPGDSENAAGGYYDAYDFSSEEWVPLPLFFTSWRD